MKLFSRAIKEAKKRLSRFGLAALADDVSFRVVRPGMESYFYKRKTRDRIGLDIEDVFWPNLVIHNRTALVLHELGHRFCDRGMPRRFVRFRDASFGKCDSHYRRNFKVRFSKQSFVSKYATVHPADDFAETFAFLVWFGNRAPEEGQRRGYGAACRSKIRTMRLLLRKSRKSLKRTLRSKATASRKSRS